MKTEFLILWVDDSATFVESIELPLKQWMDEKGLDLRVLLHKNATKVIPDIEKNEVELLIIDYKLPGKDGDILIDDIRKGHFYHDIVFYS